MTSRMLFVRARFPVLACGVALVLSLACGGGDDSPGMSVPTLTLNCTTAASPGPNGIGLSCPASSAGVLAVKVVIGGPSTSTDIYGVKFDLVFDGTVLHYDGHSNAPSFLAKGGGTVSVLASVSDTDPDRLVVGVSLEGPVSGVRVTGAEETVAEFLFRGMQPGNTTVRFENAAVVDSALNPIAGVLFAGQIQIEVP